MCHGSVGNVNCRECEYIAETGSQNKPRGATRRRSAADRSGPGQRNNLLVHRGSRSSGSAVLLIHAGAEDAKGAASHRRASYRLHCGHLRPPRDPAQRCGRLARRAPRPARRRRRRASRGPGLGDAIALGYSSSGNITLQLALRHPEQVRRGLGLRAWVPPLDPSGCLSFSSGCTRVPTEHLVRDLALGGAYVALLRPAALTTDRPPDTPPEAPAIEIVVRRPWRRAMPKRSCSTTSRS